MEIHEYNFKVRFPKLKFSFRNWLPTRGNVLFTVLLALTLLIANRAGALSLSTPSVASTTTIPYQGRLANADGSSFTGLQSMIFHLYAVPTGGTPLWTETWSGGTSVQVTDGLFSVLLGSQNTGLTSVVQGNSQLWLGIEVGTDAEMSPRVQLGSAAYAMQALTVSDASIGTAKLADGAVTTAKLADGSISTPKLSNGSVTSEKLGLNSGVSCLNSPVIVSSPGQWERAFVPGLALTITLTQASKVLIWMNGLGRTITDSSGENFVLYLDNQDYIISHQLYSGTDYLNIEGQRLADLSSGVHTMSFEVNTGTAAMAEIGGSATMKTCINYLVVGQ